MIATRKFVEEKFDELNLMCFEGKLPKITFRMSKARTFIGQFSFKKRRTWLLKTELYDFKLKISTHYDLPEDTLTDVLLHEMIHYYIAINGIKDRSAHGPVFRSMMKDLNERFGRHMTISYKVKS